MPTITRKIERRINLSPRSIYEALAKQFDLPTNPQEVSMTDENGAPVEFVDLVAVEYSEQDL